MCTSTGLLLLKLHARRDGRRPPHAAPGAPSAERALPRAAVPALRRARAAGGSRRAPVRRRGGRRADARQHTSHEQSCRLGRPAASPGLAAGRRLPSRNSQNSNYARRFSQGFSRSEWWVVGTPEAEWGGWIPMECSSFGKSPKTIQYISVLYDCMICLP